PSDAARDTFARQVLVAPAIALPFLVVGPSLLFLGIGAVVFEWATFLRWQTALVISGILAVGFGQFGHARVFVVIGHLLMVAGLAAMWRRVRENDEKPEVVVA